MALGAHGPQAHAVLGVTVGIRPAAPRDSIRIARALDAAQPLAPLAPGSAPHGSLLCRPQAQARLESIPRHVHVFLDGRDDTRSCGTRERELDGVP